MLGVVYAVDAPDDSGDLFAWAEGCGPVQRNGRALPPRLWPGGLLPDGIVFVSQHAAVNPYANLRCVNPARIRDMSSIAYRLALAAAEGIGAVSLNNPVGHDYAAGHALLIGSGGVLVDDHGENVRYTREGISRSGRCFGGDPKVVRELATRPWHTVHGSGFGVATPPAALMPVRLEPGHLVHGSALLSRAQGCLLGQVVGDALGALVEFQQSGEIDSLYPDGGPNLLADGGIYNIMAGQPTDDSEMALLLARSLVRSGGFDVEDVASLYAAWCHGWLDAEATAPRSDTRSYMGSIPFDIGNTAGRALRRVTKQDVADGRCAFVCRKAASASSSSEANGALMRVSPLGIWGWRLTPHEVDEAARADAALTHPHPLCQAASGLFAATIAQVVAHGGTPQEIYKWALEWAAQREVPAELISALKNAATAAPCDYMHHMGWVLIALQNAFYQLLHAPGAAEGVVASVRCGGDTDTNAAVCGALLGALYGRDAWPEQWRAMVLSCRPLYGVTPTRQPRPAALWPTDVLQLAERLLIVLTPRQEGA